MKKSPAKKNRRGQPHRGSVLILVVAVLALLAVMGTAYIVSARSERSNATAMSASANLELAQQAVMTTAYGAVSAGGADANYQVGGHGYLSQPPRRRAITTTPKLEQLSANPTATPRSRMNPGWFPRCISAARRRAQPPTSPD